jgi:hypothetical protein
VYQLLGGACRDSVPCFATPTPDTINNPECVAQARQRVAKGWKYLRSGPGMRADADEAERRALHAGTPPRTAFTFAGRAVDAAGFGQYLYVATPPPLWHLQPTSTSVWRADSDQDGWVIWAELVYSFDSGVSVTVPGGDSPTPVTPIPAALRSRHPVPLVRLQADANPESYNLIRIDRSETSPGTSPDDAALAFSAVDEEGGLRPGAWSYGEPVGTI